MPLPLNQPIPVTLEDIAEGKQDDLLLCPVAKALSRTLGRQVRVEVGTTLTWVNLGKKEEVCWLRNGVRLQAWIQSFDADGALAEGIAPFDLEIRPWGAELILMDSAAKPIAKEVELPKEPTVTSNKGGAKCTV